jgi:transcriptional regulator of acetoin/glycerol metabolism
LDNVALAPSRVERRLTVDRAWQQYLDDAVAPTQVPSEITASWRRARETYRIDPNLTQPRRILTADAIEDKRRHDEVLQLAMPILHEFADILADHVVAYFDAEGWLMALLGEPRIVEQVRDIHFRPGVNWSEDSAGTNGPGTALATGQPVEVFASEHFVQAWHSWSCAATPVRDGRQGKPIGLVDVTSPWQLQSGQALNLSKVIARAVEERVHSARSLRDEVVRHALRAARRAGDGLVAVDAMGRVIAVNDLADRRGFAPARALTPPVQKALTEFLASATPSDGETRFNLPDGGAIVASSVEHDGAPVGAILRLTPPTKGARAPHDAPTSRYTFARILGESDALKRVLDLARVATRNELPVVLSGESGTGKELFAHSIHAGSARASGPFVVVNCGAIPAELVEAELFGYEPGAFTGGRREGNTGRFEDACGGTIFLDEVSELPLPAQTALLRLLQEKEVVRLGGSTPRRVDVRVLAATNRPLDEEIRAKRFRRDLYYRLNVLPVAVPPLRARGDDIVLLARQFLGEAEAEVHRHDLRFSAEALEALKARAWPGNVRELKNVVLRAAATAPENEIAARDLQFDPEDVGDRWLGDAAAASGTLREAVTQSERARILDALEACAWNCTHAAAQLDISRMTLYRMLAKYGISRASGAH